MFVYTVHHVAKNSQNIMAVSDNATCCCQQGFIRHAGLS